MIRPAHAISVIRAALADAQTMLADSNTQISPTMLSGVLHEGREVAVTLDAELTKQIVLGALRSVDAAYAEIEARLETAA
jgi:hypothetical protein